MIEADLVDKMVTWRRALHAHPETAFEEVSTARLVASALRDYGFEVTEGVGKTGVVGTLRRGRGPALGLRADMDALPMVEYNEFEHRSQHRGKMHACGHDGHTAMLLGAADFVKPRYRLARYGARDLPARRRGGGRRARHGRRWAVRAFPV